MATFRDAVKRLQIIYNDCAPEAMERKEKEKGMDDFTKLKRRLHQDTKQVRQMLKEREELMSIKHGAKEIAESSYRIRARIKQMKEDANRLQTLQRQDQKFKKDETVQKGREEIVQLVFKHIEEIENLEKKRVTDKLGSDRNALFDGAAPVKIEFATFDGKPEYNASKLPDIDDDPAIAGELQILEQNNKDIDADLDQIRANVGIIKELAINMDRELEKQNAMLDNVDKKVDHAQEHLDNINLKLKNALEGVMKGDKFMVNCVLVSVLLCIVGFIASQYS